MAAKFYIYRNLNRGGFSAKRHGKVVARPNAAKVYDATLQVSEKSQARARREKRRNVHAFIVCDSYLTGDPDSLRQLVASPEYRPLFYNPFQTDTFVIAGTAKKVTFAEEIILIDDCAYLRV